MKVKCKKTGICTLLPKTVAFTARTRICTCMCVPVPESPHKMRGTGVSEDVSVCPRKHKRRPSRRLSLPHAALLMISAPCTYSPEHYACRKQLCGTKFPIFRLLWHVALYLHRYWRDKIFSVDSSLGQALGWGGHWVRLELLDVLTQRSYLSLHCFLSLDPLTLWEIQA